MSKTIRARQLSLDLKTWGGKRAHAGRKPKGARPLVTHAARPRITRSTPVHVTIRMRPEVRDLRTKVAYRTIARALVAGGNRFGLRVVHHSVQSTHIHLIVEADGTRALGRGMQGLSIRIAKRLNRLAHRRGKILADRFHAHVLRTPQETRRALQYVVNNARKHAFQRGRVYPPGWLDPFSSAVCVDGWNRASSPAIAEGPDAPPFLPPTSWLLRVGWRKNGPLHTWVIPSQR